MSKRKEARLHLRIDARVKQEAEAAAHSVGLTLTSVVEQLLRRFIEEQSAGRDIPQA